VKGTRVLVVDDEDQIRRALQRALGARGYTVATASDGEQALAEAESFMPNLIVLDLNMPVMGGLEVCRRVRSWSDVPILVLSVREEEHDKVTALDLGADDYLTKPFGIDEFLARIRALLRRAEPRADQGALRFERDGVAIDLVDRSVARDGAPVHLTRTEWALLETLAHHPGKLLMQRWLLETVWGTGYGDDVDVLRVFVSQLRKKIEPDPARPTLLVTEPGVGYRWTLHPVRAESAEDEDDTPS
jgi:two-component system KDP operon response regulator KdpE